MARLTSIELNHFLLTAVYLLLCLLINDSVYNSRKLIINDFREILERVINGAFTLVLLLITLSLKDISLSLSISYFSLSYYSLPLPLYSMC